MLTYEFRCVNAECKNYKEPFTVRQEPDDEHKAVCPVCGEPAMRNYHVGHINFVGGGFHVNDYPTKK